MVTLCAESSTFLTSDNWFFDVSSRRIGFRGVCSCACCLSVMKKFKHVLDPSNILHRKFRKVKITGEEESYIKATSWRAMSIPADTPAAVIILPFQHMDTHKQGPLSKPAAPSRREPEHTEVVYKLVSCTLSSTATGQSPEEPSSNSITDISSETLYFVILRVQNMSIIT